MLSNIPPLELYLPSIILFKLFLKRYLPRRFGRYKFKNYLSQKFSNQAPHEKGIEVTLSLTNLCVYFWGDHSTAQLWRVFYYRFGKDTNLHHQSLQMQLFHKAKGLTQYKGLRGYTVITNILWRRRQRTLIHDWNAGQDINACSNPLPKYDSRLKGRIRHGKTFNGCK